MDEMNSMNATSNITLYIMIGVAVLIIWRRTRAMYKPVTHKPWRILLPLVYVTPGFTILTQPGMELSPLEMLAAAGIGFVFSIPLILTTRYEVREDGHIYARKSMAFILTFLGIISLRFFLRGYLMELNPAHMGMLVFLIAICYLIPWRIACYVKFKQLADQRRSVNE